MSIIDTLVTDRTSYDVFRLKQLSAIGWDNMTEAERHEWLYGNSNIYWADGETITCLDGDILVDGVSNKGAYNDIDMNRVEKASGYLARLLIDLPRVLHEYADSIGVAWDVDYDVPYDPDNYSIVTKTDWAMNDIPDKSQIERYLGNVALLASAIVLESALPESMNNLSYSDANAIEEALITLNNSIGELQEKREEMLENTAKSFRRSGQFTFWSGTLPLPV